MCTSKTTTADSSDGLGCRKGSRGWPGSMRLSSLVTSRIRADVVIATETDRGLFVGALVAAGYTVLAVNPMSTSRYRERHSTSGAKSDPGDAKVLADLARTDGHNHRPIAGDSDAGRGGQGARPGASIDDLDPATATNQLRSTLREFYPAALDAFDELGRTRRAGRVGDRADPDAGTAAVALEDRIGVAARRPATPHRRTSRRDPDGAAQRAARGSDV